MSSRTAVATIRRPPSLALGAACLILVCVTASGCVLGNDNDRPVLAVDPLWDLSPSPRPFGGSCEDAGVVWMTWDIQDSRGKSLEKSEDLEPCKPLTFFGLTPGTYTLVITGYDRREEPLWSTTCKGLRLRRFDALYTCDVEQIDEGDEGGDAGAGDAGANDEDAGTD